LDKIILEINFPNVVIVDKKAHSNLRNITNGLKKFSFRGYDDPRKYDRKLFLEASDFVKRNLANQILQEARKIITRQNDKSSATIVLVDRGSAHEFYGSENSEIKMAGQQRRSIGNFDALARAVKQRHENVISTRLEEKPLAYQIALFQAADVIIGQHGAALANLIWARKGIDVVEIVPQDLGADVKDYFGSLARCLEQRYHPIQQFHSHGEVNIGEILRILDGILS
jgi:hypothetical protein